MNRTRKPKPAKRDARKRREIVVLHDVDDFLQVRPAEVSPAQRSPPWSRSQLLTAPLELGCWITLILVQTLILLGYGLRCLLQLPMLGLALIARTLQFLEICLILARINLVFRHDEQTRQRMLNQLYETIAAAQDYESEADE